jgi:TonB family protein
MKYSRIAVLAAAFLGLGVTAGVAGQTTLTSTSNESPLINPASAALLSPAMLEAEANRKRMRRPPSVRTQKSAAYPMTEKKTGSGGYVNVKGIVGTDGRFSEIVIARSNASPALNAAAITAARITIFTPAKDAAGIPISVPIIMPFEFSTNSIRPDTTSRVEAAFGAAERDAGLQGTVIVSGKIVNDGQLIEANVTVSSRSTILDNSALLAATTSRYRPYKNGSGDSIDYPISITYKFSSNGLSNSTNKLSQYRCSQFVKDELWWRANWPSGPYSELYISALSIRSIVSFTDSEALDAYRADFEARWLKAIETCQQTPDAFFVNTLKPEGIALAKLLN